MEKETTTFYYICNNLFRLDNGIYSNENDIKIEISKNNYGLIAFIENKFINLEIDLHRNGEYYSTIKLNDNVTLYQSATSRGSLSKRINLNINNNNFDIFEYQITKNGEKVCDIINNTLLKKINDNCYIGYSFNKSRTYIYYKKNRADKEKDYLDINNDFIKCEYNDKFIIACNDYIKKYDKNINNFKDLISDIKFKEIFDTILTNPLKYTLCPDINELELDSLINIYFEYKNKFNILDDELIINDIYKFTNQIINDPMEIKANNIRNTLKNINLKDISALKNLRNEIDSFIEYQQKNSYKKTK